MATTQPSVQATSGPKVVSRDEWRRARIAFLAKEKALTRQYDELARQRAELPCVKVEKEYVFEGRRGKVNLAELFGEQSQLVIYHFMFGPDWNEGCPSCSYLMDHVDGAIPHLKARDVTLMLVSRGPLAKLEAFKKRMGWHLPWVSSLESDFNFDYRVSFTPEQIAAGKNDYNFGTAQGGEESHGLSVFAKNAAGEVFHTYSTFGRGCEPFVGTYMILDMVPKGRDEANLSFTMEWVRHHDKYQSLVQISDSSCHSK